MAGTEDERPDPDALLAQLAAEERRAGRARLKIFFGAAPGVGKTFTMLEAAQAARRDGQEVGPRKHGLAHHDLRRYGRLARPGSRKGEQPHSRLGLGRAAGVLPDQDIPVILPAREAGRLGATRHPHRLASRCRDNPDAVFAAGAWLGLFVGHPLVCQP